MGGTDATIEELRQALLAFKETDNRERLIAIRSAANYVATTRGALFPTDVRKTERNVSSETARTIL